MQDFGLDPYSAELYDLQRRRALAQAQQQQGMDTSPIRHWSQGAARLAATIMGGRESSRVAEEMKALAARREAEQQAETAKVLEALQPTGQPAARYVDALGNEAEGAMAGAVTREAQPGTRPDRMTLARTLAGMKSPQFRAMGLQLAMQKDPEEEAFTLSPGQKRFRGKSLVAEVPPEPEKPEKDPEVIRLTRIANDPTRSEFDRRTAAAMVAKMTSHQPATTVNVNGQKEEFKNEKTLRDEYTEASKQFVKIRDAFSQVRDALAGDISAPATLAGATKFMKMLDPDSVVRESELNMALKSTGMLDRFMNLHNTIQKGGVLTPKQAAEIQRIAGVLYDTAEKEHKRTADYYTRLAGEYNLNPERIVRDLSLLGGKKPGSDLKARSGGGGAVMEGPGAMPRPSSKAERDALPPGTLYIAPDGSARVR